MRLALSAVQKAQLRIYSYILSATTKERCVFMDKFYGVIAEKFSGIFFDDDNLKKVLRANTSSQYQMFATPQQACEFVLERTAPSAKFYVVRNGTICGIFTNWRDCEPLVKGYENARYKSFKGFDDAVSYYLDKKQPTQNKSNPENIRMNHKVPFAYVDGSYNVRNGKYGYGVILATADDVFTFCGAGNDAELASMRNVAGEIEGAKRAIKEAEKLGLSQITIYYDYKGIEKWATGEWKRNLPSTEAYHRFVKNAHIRVNFVKVKAHSNVALNERVDQLAKREVGIY